MYWLIEILYERDHRDAYKIVACSFDKHKLPEISTNSFIVDAPEGHNYWIAELYEDGGIKSDYTSNSSTPEGWQYCMRKEDRNIIEVDFINNLVLQYRYTFSREKVYSLYKSHKIAYKINNSQCILILLFLVI